MQADRRLIAGGTIYVTRVPCFMCAKMIANSGIARAVFPITEDDADRRPDNSITILKDSGVEVTLWKV
jgi:deoxycytidylate deaminase